ncbi:MAG TPA: glyoxylate/hydroxypyruvate reductase A [Alphaproteobacteria bacterium]|nr:glyoxylate/hydroxypyruvate reductase A [Alphaproteobacteria bacterium]
MTGAMMFYSKFDDANDWRDHLLRAMPGLNFRPHPDVGDPAEIESAMVWKAPPGELRKYPNLKLIVNIGAGVDYILKDTTLPPNVPIMRIVDPEMNRMMAQYVLLAVLRYHRDFPALEKARRAKRWHYIHPRESATLPVGIMGLGHLGTMAAQELLRQGFPVSGWSRTPKSVEGVATFHGPAQLKDFLARSQILVLMMPFTPETDSIVNRDVLYALPRGAKVINVGRGQLVDEAALAAAIREGQIGGATLDVFRTEPLPPDHPFWDVEEVTITPHLASIAVPRTAAPQIAENLRRLRAGEPLFNLVDRSRGY